MTVLKKLTFAGVAGTMAVCAGLILAGCSSAEHDAIVARVGNDVITLSDFRKMYAKSNAGQDIQSSTQGSFGLGALWQFVTRPPGEHSDAAHRPASRMRASRLP